MKFLVDAQLPIRLARFLQASGYNAIHTLDLPQRNYTEILHQYKTTIFWGKCSFRLILDNLCLVTV